jgi:glycosyltransferase involved in cell wall biosynthesis
MERITCIINARNAAQYIKASIDSVLAQTIPVKLLVVDNHSTDHTHKIASEYGKKLTLISTPQPAELGAARAFSFQFVETEFVSWLDADDLWEPNFCEFSLQAFEVHPEAALVSSATILIDEFDKELPSPKQYLRAKSGVLETYQEGDTLSKMLFKQRCEASWQSYVFRTAIVRQIGGLNSRLSFAVDLDLVARVLLRGRSIHISKNLSRCRIHSGQATLAMNPQLRCRECFEILSAVGTQAGVLSPQDIGRLDKIIKFKAYLTCFLERKSLPDGFRASLFLLNPFVAFWFVRRTLEYSRN